MPTSFTITDAAEIVALGPYLEREVQKDSAKVAFFEKEAARRRGVCFSGSAPLEMPKERSDAERLIAAKQAYSANKRFAAGSRGRFIQAIANLQKPGGMYALEADIARKAFHRGFQDETQPVCIHEIGVALEALHAVPGSDAGEARLALAELLMRPAREAA